MTRNMKNGRETPPSLERADLISPFFDGGKKKSRHHRGWDKLLVAILAPPFGGATYSCTDDNDFVDSCLVDANQIVFGVVYGWLSNC